MSLAKFNLLLRNAHFECLGDRAVLASPVCFTLLLNKDSRTINPLPVHFRFISYVQWICNDVPGRINDTSWKCWFYRLALSAFALMSFILLLILMAVDHATLFTKRGHFLCQELSVFFYWQSAIDFWEWTWHIGEEAETQLI